MSTPGPFGSRGKSERGGRRFPLQNNRESKEAYHHGDLRRALIEIATRHVRLGGAGRFSLREAAREAGVTSGAAYRHFPDKDALLGAVAGFGFRLLAERTAEAVSGLAGAEFLLATGRTYIAFASDEPMLFRLMFSTVGVNVQREAREDGAYEQLKLALAGLQGIAPEVVDEGILALAWSVAHGAASLISEGVWQGNDGRAEAALQRFAGLIALKASSGFRC
jgi:AcrR family transcriptional regulator